MRFHWRRWWITYALVHRAEGQASPRRERAGPYLTRHTAAHAVESIWRDKALPPDLLIVQEPLPMPQARAEQ